MASKCKRIGVPYFSSNQVGNAPFDKMKVEEWPVVQAYALEGYGRLGISYQLFMYRNASHVLLKGKPMSIAGFNSFLVEFLAVHFSLYNTMSRMCRRP